ncbi:hypothetical protein THIARS_71049 [Thiomonas delicata]|uniref:Uncharacterized protein n=1 Tax=Thiomonas delicata TaxID=364030 RepID=A0A238D870_THIDL|nr:hypothetical protein THIARS_71049 [Thiomonas delicata]
MDTRPMWTGSNSAPCRGSGFVWVMVGRVEEGLEMLVERPVLAWRLAGGLLCARGPHQLAQGEGIGVRVVVQERGQRRVVLQEPGAPVFERMHASHRLAAFAGGIGQRLAQWRGINLAHELADVLGMAPAALVGADALHLAQGLAQGVGRVEHVDAVRGQGGKLLAEILQGLHVAFELALAGRQVGKRPGVGVMRRGGKVGGGFHRPVLSSAPRVLGSEPGLPRFPGAYLPSRYE